MYIVARYAASRATFKYRVLRKRKPPVVGDVLWLRGFDAWHDEQVKVIGIIRLRAMSNSVAIDKTEYIVEAHQP